MEILKKRKRNVRSIEDKVKIIEKLDNGSTLDSIAIEYNIGLTTVRRIRDSKDTILTYIATADAPEVFKKRKTMKTSTFKDLDTCLIEWFHQERALGTAINGPIVAAQAKYFFDQLDLEGKFNASNGWLTRFKNRYGIREISVQGEKLSSDMDAAKKFVDDFLEFMESKNLTLEQIYNADETGLYWRCLPQRTLAAEREKSAPGVKPSKERVTILCCANATGNDRLQLALIGKSKKPQCFKNTPPHEIPVDYYHQTSAWMDRDIFTRWFHDKFVPHVRENLRKKNLPEKAVLILDNAPSHPAENLLKTEDGMIFVKYLPANVTALIQPMDQGVIAALKKTYRSNLLKNYVQKKLDLKSFKATSNILTAIIEVSSVWSNMKTETLRNSWRKLLSSDLDLEITPEITVGENIDVPKMAQTFKSIAGGELVDENDVLEWMECDENSPVFESLSPADIVAKVTDPTPPTREDEDEIPVKKKMNHADALAHVEKLLDYHENNENASFTDIMFLRKMQSNIRKNQLKSDEAKKQRTLENYFQI